MPNDRRGKRLVGVRKQNYIFRLTPAHFERLQDLATVTNLSCAEVLRRLIEQARIESIQPLLVPLGEEQGGHDAM